MYVDELEGDCNVYVDTHAMSLDVCRKCHKRLISDPDVRRVPAEYEIGVKKPEQISCRVTLLTSGAF
jgi:hypothetical protein